MLEQKTESIRELAGNNTKITNFDRDVFDALIKDVIVGGTNQDGFHDPYQITFVLSQESLTNPIMSNDVVVLDEFNMPYIATSFEKAEDGSYHKEVVDHITIRIALEEPSIPKEEFISVSE